MENTESFCSSRQGTIWARYLGIILPMAVNYGFLLLRRDRPHWGAVVASLVVLAVLVAFLVHRRDRRGAVWVGLLYFPLNAWPIALTAIGGLGD